MTAPHRSDDDSSRRYGTTASNEEETHASEGGDRPTPSFDEALRGYARDEMVDPAHPGDGRRIEADRIPPAPIAPSRRWTLGALVPVALLLCGLAAAIYVWMRA
jgi:hypothetical protein